MRSTTAPVTASTWRRKRRQVSSAGEIERAVRGPATVAAARAGASAERDTGVEPAIEDVCNEVEEDDETGDHEGDAHHDGSVVGQNRRDQQRADARHAEDLLGDDGAA